MKKQFMIIFMLVCFLVVMMGSCSLLMVDSDESEQATSAEKNEHEASQQTEKEKQEQEQEEEMNEPEEEQPTYSFIGATDGITDEPVREEEPPEDTAPEDKTEGYIPELTIENGNVNMKDVKSHYGFVPALITDEKFVGRVKSGEIVSIDDSLLQDYAQRGRDASGDPELRKLAEKVSSSFDDSVYPVYMVPNDVEEYFVETQMQAIQEQGLSPEDVDLVRARYRRDYSIEVIEIE